MTSIVQLEANRKNAQKSTGPKTPQGKSRAGRNALKHGILSKHLLLEDETAQEFDALLGGLQAALHPVGELEHVLVERIAITLWRQKRLVRAEAATIEFYRAAGDLARCVGSYLGDYALRAADLEPPDPEQITWCEKVIAEYGVLDSAARRNWRCWQRQAPLIFQQLI
jgi:hypothetical protein